MAINIMIHQAARDSLSFSVTPRVHIPIVAKENTLRVVAVRLNVESWTKQISFPDRAVATVGSHNL